MNKFNRSSRVLLPLALSAALMFTGCQSDGTPASESAASSGSASAAAVAAEQTSAVLSSLTDAELQELISGSATLEQLAQQRTEASPTQAASSTASSSVPAASAASPAAAASATTTAPAYEQELKALINQLYDVKARAESGLNSAIQEATAEYKALPASKQTKARKISICMGKAGQLKSLESSCDKEVAEIVAKMRTLLTENGQSTALADEAEATYKAQKNAMYASLSSKLYG